MFIDDTYHDRTPDLDLESIGKIIGTKKDGTLPETVLNLNKVKEVATALPSIEFEFELKRHTLDEINDEIEDKQPPIAWTRLTEKGGVHKCPHAVIITDLERKNNRIYYNDPIHGKVEEALDVFLDNWEIEDRVLIKVKIGKRPQRILEEFPQEEKLMDKQTGG
jgi:hypothetical protein